MVSLSSSDLKRDDENAHYRCRAATCLLPLCTANPGQPRLREHTVFMLTDMYPSLKALASDCLSNQGEARMKRVLAADGIGADGKRGRPLVEEEADGIVQFWKDEWFVE